ncbi:hypothetical protein J7400_19025 [Shimia sp. R9_2]|uniref:ASCH domain-containing protein n=1 Tax=Shimia sp. R9_2 TaxID=2821112 RepID=UPI001ADC7B8B|nr:ASCH domain-containing protein [Shimia sp. R9_2]MBO9398771.1 hypothetical protein [Shimia sp. R9_2]
MIHPDLPLKALSIRQPWAWAIINAGKNIENRPRRFHYRGPICIHASRYEPTAEDKRVYLETAVAAYPNFREFVEICRSSKGEIKGGIIGTAEIVDCIDQSDSPWFFGPYGLVLENVTPVDFIPVKGALGLFDWRKKLEAAA